MKKLLPKQQTPDLDVESMAGHPWHLKDKSPENFMLLLFFRGLHCPVCGKYLKDFDKKLQDFENKGIEIAAISMETENRTRKAMDGWKIKNLEMCYGLKKDQALEWGLYLSKSIKEEEPDLFCEPAMFLVRPDRTLYWAHVQSMPFARPPVSQMIEAIDFILDKNYPARGEYSE